MQSPKSIEQEHDLEAAISEEKKPTKMQKGENSIKHQATGFLSQKFGMVAGQSKSHKK